MKKMMSIVCALLLCLSAVAVAEGVPSKTTGDLNRFDAVAENQPADSNWFVRPVVEDEAAYQARLDVCNKEIEKLATVENVQAYFGDVKDAEGNAVALNELMGEESLNVFEFCPLVADSYEESFGKVNAKMYFSTPYAKGQKVVVMIGLVTINADGTQSVEWVAYEGVGLGEVEGHVEMAGGIEVELNPEIVLAIQNGMALLAIISK